MRSQSQTAIHFARVLGLVTITGCSSATSNVDIITIAYSLARSYTGLPTNELFIEAAEGSEETYEFSLSSEDADLTFDVDTDVYLPVISQTVTISYTTAGVHSADFRVRRKDGEPYLYEILNWEFNTDPPTPPIISFADDATATLENPLLISDSRTENTTEIWIGGDISTEGKSNVEDGGFWQNIATGQVSTPVTLTSGDGIKTVTAKFKNIFGNISEEAVPAEIYLKQTPPEGCDAVPLSTTIGNNKLSLKMSGQDSGPLYYTIRGDVRLPADQNPFSDQDIIYVYTEPTPGTKTVTVWIEDVAGNFCLEKEITILLDPNYESEGIWVQDSTYWTTTENVKLDVFFDHFPDQEPLQIKITGDVSGANTNSWVDYEVGIPVTLSPTTSGSRRIYAQYKDVDGVESYLISKRIFLKPTVALAEIAAPDYNLSVSNILDADGITIVGCAETYTNVAHQDPFPCEMTGADVDVTYHFDTGDDLTLTAEP